MYEKFKITSYWLTISIVLQIFHKKLFYNFIKISQDSSHNSSSPLQVLLREREKEAMEMTRRKTFFMNQSTSVDVCAYT